MNKQTIALLLTGAASAKVTPLEVGQIFEGVMIGALKTEDLGDFVTCTVTDGERVTQDIEDAVAQLKKHSMSGLATGLEDMADVLKTISEAIKTCSQQKDYDQLKKLEQLIESFKNPRTFMWHIGEDILVNGISIEHEIQDAITMYDGQNYEAFGEDIGAAMAMVFLGTDQTEVPDVGPTKIMPDFKGNVHQVEEIVAGILVGAVEAEGLENIEGCIKDSEHFFDDVLDAVQDFEKHTASGKIAGLKKLGDALHDVMGGIKDCSGVEADLKLLAKMVEIFRSPSAFAFHVGKDLLVNGISIYKEIKDSVKQFEDAEYYKFGEDVGNALALLVFGGAPLNMLEKAEDIRIPARAVEPEQFFIY